jgi:hypothetical protein
VSFLAAQSRGFTDPVFETLNEGSLHLWLEWRYQAHNAILPPPTDAHQCDGARQRICNYLNWQALGAVTGGRVCSGKKPADKLGQF